ncbi:hypothetical protein [Antrihabitans cavernicola]|uniref:MFS transporter n=1 Tax=Antrihabitans cavernicola TaxID=2495913 RepID=A0A5A7SCF2_9NOCA|nr:hypothetical protein [Spelaeibacter cavernicola]KAA0022175.1 hypothetical protein FOY51_14350 [Spelaeibacter cavernicola]
MPPTLRELIAVVAALFAGGAAVFVLSDDLTANWVLYATGGDNRWWLSDSPTGIALGAIVAVGVCVVVGVRGSRRGGWGAVAALGALIVAATLAPRAASGVDLLETAQIVRCIAAGGMLGAAAAACHGRIAWQSALAAGAVAAAASAAVRSSGGIFLISGSDEIDSSILRHSDPNWWLLAGAVVLAATAAATTPSGYQLPQPNRRSIGNALGGVVVFAIGSRLFTEWISRDAINHRSRIWLAVFVSVGALLAISFTVARLARPGLGRFILVALGVAANFAVLTRDMRAVPQSAPTPWFVFVVALATIAGLRISSIRPNAVLGLAIVAIVPLSSALSPEFGNNGIGMVLRFAVAALGAGYALGSSYPSESPFTAFGVAILSTSALQTAAAVPEIRRINFSSVGDSPASGFHSFGDANEYRLAGLAMLIVIVACAAGVFGLRGKSGTAKPIGFGPAR